MGDKNTVETLDLNGGLKENKNVTPNKKSNSSLVVIIILAVIVAIGVGVYIWYSNTNAKMKSVIKDAARNYYEKYTISNTSAGAYTITLQDLKRANEEYGEKYNLSAVEKCDFDKTAAIVNIDYTNGEIKDIKIKLNCKIY